MWLLPIHMYLDLNVLTTLWQSMVSQVYEGVRTSPQTELQLGFVHYHKVINTFLIRCIPTKSDDDTIQWLFVKMSSAILVLSWHPPSPSQKSDVILRKRHQQQIAKFQYFYPQYIWEIRKLCQAITHKIWCNCVICVKRVLSMSLNINVRSLCGTRLTAYVHQSCPVNKFSDFLDVQVKKNQDFVVCWWHFLTVFLYHSHISLCPSILKQIRWQLQICHQNFEG